MVMPSDSSLSLTVVPSPLLPVDALSEFAERPFDRTLPPFLAIRTKMEVLRPGCAVKVLIVMVITAIFFRCVTATNHSVGGHSGWDLSSDIRAWSAETTFRVGDFLVFNYLPLHDVMEVNRMDFAICRTVNPINTHNDGETVIQLKQPGTRYFICGRLQHCQMGLKLRVQVLQQLSKDNNSTAGHRPHPVIRSPPPQHPSPPSPRSPAAPPFERPPLREFPGGSPPCTCSGAGKVVPGGPMKWWSAFLITLATRSCSPMRFHPLI